MKRKIEALFLSFAIAIGITLPVAAASETANGISVSDSEVCVGEEFTVTLNVPAAENADTAIIRVNFDSTAFTVTEWEPSLSGQVKNAGVDSKGVGFFLVNAANAQRAIDLSKGLALTAKIKVKDDAEIKDYTFDLVSASLSYWNEETFKDVELWTPTTTKVTVSVKPAPVPATGITLNQKTLTLVEGKTETLEATVSPENSTDKVVWKSSESGVATVDQTGKVTAVKAGTTVITATAGTKSASCEVTVTCAHKNTVDVAAKASTCKEQGNEAYTKCKDCGEIIKGSDKALPLVSHKGGEATCVKKAVCEVCGDEYGDYAPHTYGELIAEVEKTCTTDGTKAHFECSVCKKVFDESKKETTEEALKIAASHGDTEIKNAKEATTEEEGYTGDTYCKDCGEKIKDGEVIPKIQIPATGIVLNKKTLTLAEGISEILKAIVSPENSTDKVVWKSSDVGVAAVDQTGKVTAVKAGTTVITATAGTKSASCEVTVTCAHKNTVDVAAKASTCKEQGNEAYTKCKDCGEIIKGSDKALPLVSHKGGEATCVKKAVCEVCGDEYGDYAPHTYGELIAEVGKTCTTDGIKAHFECSVCKKVFDESKKETTKEALKIAASHGDTEIKNAKEATTEEDGYTGDTYCKVCGEKIKDGEVIPKLHPVLTDTDTGITVEAEADVLPTGTLLVVEPVSAEAENESVFDITLTDLNGEKIQPNGKVSVKVPVPEKFKDTENLYVYRVEGEKYIYIESSIVDNQVVFEVDHFSTYVITAEKHEEVPDTGVDFGISMGALLLAGATAIIASKKAKK